jgi:uncharacterized protein
MNSMPEKRGGRLLGLFYIVLALLVLLVLYPLVGVILTMAATGGRLINPGFVSIDAETLARLRAVQAVGQVLVLALPVFWIARWFSGSRKPFGPVNLRWLGIAAPRKAASLAAAAAGMLLLQPAMYTIAELQNRLMPLFGEKGREFLQEQERLELIIRTLASAGSFPEFLAVAAVLVVTPAICEELFFRGYVQKGFSEYLAPGRAVLLTGFVFALFHMEPTNIVPLTLLGWFIGYIYQKSGSLAIPATAHATNNLMALLLLQFDLRFNGASLSDGDARILFMWQWWAVVLACLALFFLLAGRFPETAASGQPDNV